MTIYYSVTARRKSIRYVIAQKGEEYVIAFWNSSNQSIMKEDIYAFCLFVDGDIKCIETCYEINPVPLKLSVGGKHLSYDKQLEITFNSPVNRIDFSFDYLYKRSGYIVSFKNMQDCDHHSHIFQVFGIIRGENDSSIALNKRPLTLRNWPNLIKSIFSGLITIGCYTYFGAVCLYNGIMMDRNIDIYIGIGSLILAILATLIFAFTSSLPWSIHRMPLDFRPIYKKYLRSGYKEIRPESPDRG